MDINLFYTISAILFGITLLTDSSTKFIRIMWVLAATFYIIGTSVWILSDPQPNAVLITSLTLMSIAVGVRFTQWFYAKKNQGGSHD